jgi:hypothetical protein
LGLLHGDDGRPPESIESQPIDVEDASRLMVDLGFVAFRTPAGAAAPDSCLMVMIHDEPTGRHFDTEVITYWGASAGRGHLLALDRTATLPLSRDYSWGRIRIVDRFGAQNAFVSFGGTLTGESISDHAHLFIFRSPAIILRLPGHSQREDRLAEEAVSFFGRVIPHLWRADAERDLSSRDPLDLYAAFLLHTRAELAASLALREALGAEEQVLHRELRALEARGPGRMEAGRALLAALGIAVDGP